MKPAPDVTSDKPAGGDVSDPTATPPIPEAPFVPANPTPEIGQAPVAVLP